MRLERLMLVGGFCAGLGLTLMDCGGARCGPECAGCCNQAGFCVPGTNDRACGSGGQECVACRQAQFCVQQACSGATGGKVPWDGGPVTCSSTRTYNVRLRPDQVTSVRYRRFSDGTVWNRVRYDLEQINGGLYVYQQIYFTPPLQVPVTETFTSTLTWEGSLSRGTAMALTECDSTGSCGKRYLSHGGEAHYRSVGSTSSGRMTGDSTAIHLVAWDFRAETVGGTTTVIADEPLDNADCIDVVGMEYDLTYRALNDGGVTFQVVATPDGGSDAGANDGG